MTNNGLRNDCGHCHEKCREKHEVWMSIENRVETLEHELKILKNEIQSTLLEIQNQVLVHYYPSFRAEETVTSRDQLPFVDVPASHKSKAKDNAGNRAGSDVDYVQPKTREVSLDVIKGKPDALAPLQPPAMHFKREVVALDDDDDDDDVDAGDETGSATELNQLALTHLARWVNDSVAKIGKIRTAEMIDSWDGVAHSTPAMTDALRQLLDLSDESEPAEPVNTKQLMDVLLKFNKMVDQVAKVIAAS